MSEESREILRQALALPESERAEVAGALLESLPRELLDPSVEEAWREEIARRLSQLDSGEAETVTWEDVRESLQAKLRAAKS